MIRTDEQHVLAFRLSRQGLVGNSKTTPAEATAAVVGVQAQVMAAARLSLWARLDSITPEAIDKALWHERKLVRTWCMRGTVHLVRTRDLPVILNAVRRGVTERVRLWLKNRLPGVDLDRMAIAVVDALGDKPRTRRELAESLAHEYGPMAEALSDAWGGAVRYAALQGLVCFGPPRNQEITYVRSDRWLRDVSIEHAEDRLVVGDDSMSAVEVLLQRYLHAFGPATVQDFAYWSGLTVAEARAAAKKLGSKLVEVEWDGRTGLMCAEDVPPLETALEVDLTEPVLLPQFDVYLLGHRDKRQFIAESRYKEVFRKAGWVSAVVLQGGRAIGVWSHKRVGGRLVVTITLFTRLTRETRDAVAGHCESLARFLKCSKADVRFETLGP